MKKFWMAVAGRQFATDRSLAPFLDPHYSRYYNLLDVGTIRGSVSDQNVNVDVTVDNAGLICTRFFLLTRSPIGAPVQIFEVGDTAARATRMIFEGTVYHLSFSDLKCVLGCQT